MKSSPVRPFDLRREAVGLLKELVNISSPTADSFAVDKVQYKLEKELTSLGFDVRFMPNPNSNVRSGVLLNASLTGAREDRYITFVAHADTVLGTEVAGRFSTSRDGRTANGSGVIDNKGGLVVALMGVKLYLTTLASRPVKKRVPPLSLRFVISPNEEGGSIGFHEEFARLSRESLIVLGFEPSLENGSIVESRRGNRWYNINIKGEEAHAGRCRGEEINAAHDLGFKIAKLAKLNRPSAGIGLNFARIEGGRDRFNIVCGEISAKLDTRFETFDSRDELHSKIDKILLAPAVTSPVTGRKSVTTYTIEDDCPPFSSTQESRKFLRLYLQAIEESEGRAVKAEKAGGAGDVNYMSRRGVIVFDGLGPTGGKMHTPGEFINLESLSTRALALSRFLAQLNARTFV